MYSADPVTLALTLREPKLLSLLSPTTPESTALEALTHQVHQITSALLRHQRLSNRVYMYKKINQSMPDEPSEKTQRSSWPPQVFCGVIEHFEMLTLPSRRLEFERLLRTFSALGQPRQFDQNPNRRFAWTRERRTHTTSTTGELHSMSRRGSLERVCRSELLYLGQDVVPGVDGFALKWSEGDLIFYQRKQDEHNTTLRSWSWHFHDPDALARDHVGLSKLSIAHLVSLWIQRAAHLHLGRESQGSLGVVWWSWGDAESLSQSPHVHEAKELLSLLAREDLQQGRCSFRSPDPTDAAVELELVWTTHSSYTSPHAIIINLDQVTRPQISIPPYWREALSCPADIHLSIDEVPTSTDSIQSQVPPHMLAITQTLSVLLSRWYSY